MKATLIRLTDIDRARIEAIIYEGYATTLVGAIRWALVTVQRELILPVDQPLKQKRRG